MLLVLSLNVMGTTLQSGEQSPSDTGTFPTFIMKLHTWAKGFEKPATTERS